MISTGLRCLSEYDTQECTYEDLSTVEIEEIHKVLPKRQELFDDVMLVCSIRLASLRVPCPNWLIDEHYVAEIRPGPSVRNGTISAGLPYHRAYATLLGQPVSRLQSRNLPCLRPREIYQDTYLTEV